MTDPERSKGRKKGSTEVRKKGKKVQSDNTVNEQEAPDTLICNRCKGIFTSVNAKMICYNRCQKWYCIKCVNITDAFYSFLVSKEADDIAWFCKACKEPAKKAIIEDKCIEDKCKEYTKKINEKLRSLEVDLQNKADTIEIDRLQRRIENIEKSIRKLGGEDKEDKPWSTLTGTSTKVEEVIQKSLKDRAIEERERQNRRKNIIVFGLPESDKPEPETRREEDIQKMVGLCRNIFKIDITSRDVRRAVRLGKATENNERPLLIAMDEETKK